MAEKRKRKAWSRSFGTYGCLVRVYESRGPGSRIHADIRVDGRSRRRTLKQMQRKEAEDWGKKEQARLKLGLSEHYAAIPTAKLVIDLYIKHHSPSRSKATQADDKRQAEMWKRALDPRKDMCKLNREEWERFIRLRRSGEIDARGNVIPEGKRREVRDRSVASDLEWLRGVILWAMSWQDENGHYVMQSNPVRGYKIPKEKNPRRPVATQDRYEATRAVSDRVAMDIRREGRRVKVRSYLSEILDIANGTGRRLSAVLKLKHADLRLDEGPHGSIAWPADTDKERKEWLTPVNASVRQALDRVVRERQTGVLSPWLFPSPRNPRRPISKDLASLWLERAEKMAKLPKLEGSLWHAYRRKWACERKDLPDVDVAQAGGWSDLTALKTAYQQPDNATLYRVVSEPSELREAKPR